ncbi:RHS repeat protein [Luteibacter jiangsuensis]|uniref:RHS repeat protein n=1 Tax=Luteibacter jiangsuensis TaxID=637577 RepID=A0ABX0Q7F1_9GAMM|nr:DUF6531 domain-containing protein [Luteibacter jiangsuensis]NID05885.1 RHS repeat protein [Luteibacter jiangsuensis]
MKTFFGVMGLVLVAGRASAEDYWFALDFSTIPPPADSVHYQTADAACRAGYEKDKERFEGNPHQILLAYTPPTVEPQSGPNFFYDCRQNWTYTIDGISWSFDSIPHLVQLQGDSCPNLEVFDPQAGQCESLAEFNRRRQLGDPDNNPNNDPNDCQGNPINAAIGNKFERETDFVDQGGELIFARYYNGLLGTWRHTYSDTLTLGDSSAVLTFDDGRSSLFAIQGSTITSEPSERGILARTGSNWTYTGPDNRVLTFDGMGQLIAVKFADGRTTRLTHGYDANFNPQVTVKDSQGRVLTWGEDISGSLVHLSATGLSVTYTYGPLGQLVSVARTVASKTTTRTYLYEVADNPTLLTGLIDERGVRFASWSYDDQGRAISSEHAGGAEKVTITYVDDATTKVTNALGHTVTYTYTVAAGTRRMSHVQGEPVPGCPISNSSFTYDARGQIATKTDALGHVTAFEYDAQGRETSRTEAQGTPEERVITTAWDGTSFRPKTVTTPERVTTYTYDTKGRLSSTSVAARTQ